MQRIEMLTVITSEWRLLLSFFLNVWQKPIAIFQYPFSLYSIIMESPILAGLMAT